MKTVAFYQIEMARATIRLEQLLAYKNRDCDPCHVLQIRRTCHYIARLALKLSGEYKNEL